MLTVLMATYNGAGTLPRVLKSFSQLVAPEGGWRLVVVNNLSTDDTPRILENFRNELPLLVLDSDRRGKNVALNQGLAHVEGDLVVLTDDDVIPDCNWLVSLRRAADRNTSYDIFGGHITPVWPENMPEWILRLVNLGATYGITPRELTMGPIAASRIWGANMAVRNSVFTAGNHFHEGVGPAEGQYMMGSEVEFTTRIERLGHKAWFVADASVGHIIRKNQVDREWIVQRSYRLGRHMYHQEIASLPSDTKLLRGAPRWKYRQLLSAISRSLTSSLVRNFDAKFSADWEVSFLRGYLAEASRVMTRG